MGVPIWRPGIVWDRSRWHSGRHLVPFWFILAPFWLPFGTLLALSLTFSWSSYKIFHWPLSHAILIYFYYSSDHFYANCRCIVRFSSCKAIHSSVFLFVMYLRPRANPFWIQFRNILVEIVRHRSSNDFVFIFHAITMGFWHRCIIADILVPFSGRFLRAFVAWF